MRNGQPVVPGEVSVAVVDDDDAIRDAVSLVLESVGIAARSYPSAAGFFGDPAARACRCLILDVRMPGMSGIEVQRRLLEQRWNLPIVFITGHGEIGMAVEVMKRGAVEFLQKPFKDQVLIDAVQAALARQSQQQQVFERRARLKVLLETLTPRERDVFAAVARGLRTKVVAAELGIATKTAEEYRARVFEKLQVKTAAELAALAMEARLLGEAEP